MSNQCSNLSNCRSFSFCTPFLTPLKPYATTLRPFFPLQHKLILIGRRSRSRSSSLHLTLAAQSDLVLIATTEHRDGSLVFRFGDASEMVENEVVEEVESETEQQSGDVKVLEGDHDAQVIVNTGGRGYDSVEGRVIEVADGIKNADVECDTAESETNAIRDLRDYHAESIERLSYISEKEVRSSQSDATMNHSPKVAESAHDEAKFSVQIDEEESSDPTVNLLDNSVDIENGANPEGTLLNGSDGNNVDPAVPIELESTEVSQVESMDDFDKVEKDTRKSDIEDLVPSAYPATMHISDIELTDVTNEDKEEDLKDMIINESNLIDELSPSNPLDVSLIVAVNEDVEEDLQDMNINEATIIDEMPSCDQFVVEPTLDEVSQLQFVHVMDQTVEHELPQVSTEIREENDVAFVMPASHIEDAERAVEEEVIQPQSIPLELKPATQVLNIDLQDTMGQNLDDEILQVVNETNNPLIAVKLETIQLSDNEVMDLTQPYTKDESHMVESKYSSNGDTKDFLPPATMHVSDVDSDERLQDVNISEATFIDEMPTSDPLGAEPTLEGSTTKGMDVKDVDMDERLQDMNISETTFIDERPTSDPFGAEPTVEVSSTGGIDVKHLAVEDHLKVVSNDKMDENEIANVMPAEPILEEKVSQPHSTPVELKPNMQVSGIKVQDITCQNTDDEILQAFSEDAGNGYNEDVEQPPHQLESLPIQDEGVKHNMLKQERLQDMNISEGTFMYEMPTFDPLGAEPTSEVSTTEGMNVKDLAVEDELQLVSIDKIDENEIADVVPAEPILEQVVSPPHLTPFELEATMQVSDIKVTGQNPDDEILQVINDDVGDSYIEDVEQSSHQVQSHFVQDEGVKHNMIEQCAESDAVESSILLNIGSHDPLLEAERTKAMVDSSEFAKASAALLLAAEAEVEREEIYLTDDILLSGAALLEHPFKALTGGDDAYFVAGSKWLGVASGVSQWSFEGTGPGVYAQELMRTCEEILLETSSVPVTNPVELLCRGVKKTNMSGSSNVLIANFNGQALHVANVGDTGFLIIRHGAVFKKSSPLLHEFHFALQVEDSDDPLQLVEEHLIELEVGDIVVSATDGLFDNLYEREISMIVSKSLQAGMKPQEIANTLATRAKEVGKSAFVRSPFSDAAQAAGYTGYAGGKPDNVAVVVSLVENRSKIVAA